MGIQKLVNLLLLSFIFLYHFSSAGLYGQEQPVVSEAPIELREGVLYSNSVYVKFKR